MSDRPTVLQGGQARRGRRLRRARNRPLGRRTFDGRDRGHAWLGFAALGLAVTLVVLLAFMAPKAFGPAPREVAHSRTASPPAVTRSSYGLVLAPPQEQVSVKLKLALTSGLLFDVRTGAVLWELHPQRVVPIASLTKMMTALVVLMHSSPSDHVLITPAAVHFTGSGVGLLPLHKRVPELALLYGLLLPSGNDAAIALAQHVAGTQPRFVSLMNAQAQHLGLHCTHFNSVSGVVDLDNRSCAPDLALMAHEVLEQPLLARIVASPSVATPFPIKGGKLFLYNNNPLLVDDYPGTDGVKTGFTDAAGQCLVATARRGRNWLGVVLLHSGNTAAQADTLLNAGFAKLGRG